MRLLNLSSLQLSTFAIRNIVVVLGISVGLCFSGCGTTNQRKATEQLIMSDAVDRAIGEIDFGPLEGTKVYFDEKYIKPVQGIGFVNAPYIISSIRQQLVGAGCLLQDTRESADVIVEARVGTLGTDGHEMTFGIPQSNTLNSAAAVFSGTGAVPAIPEVALAKSDVQDGAAKIGVFAYERESKKPVWQSGVRTARSNSQNTWVLGAGPWQKGSIHDQRKFAGKKLKGRKQRNVNNVYNPAPVDYNAEITFNEPVVPPDQSAQVAEKPEDKGKKK